MTGETERSSGDELFALLQKVLPQHLLSRGMHALARSRQPAVRNLVLRTVLRAYPQIDMHEALQPDPFTYESFNAFFTRELRPGARPIATDAHALVSPVDGTVSQLGRMTAGALLQAKGMQYSCAGLLADVTAAARYHEGSFACLYLAPYNYHRIHLPCDAVLRVTRYVPGQLFSVNAATARTSPICSPATNASSVNSTPTTARSAWCWWARCSSAASRPCSRARSIHRPVVAARFA